MAINKIGKREAMRAALNNAAAQASGEAAPSDEEIETLARDYCDDPTVGAIVFTSTRDCVDFARALLSRYGQAPAASPDFPHYEMAFICRVLEGDHPEKADLDTALGMARSVRVALLKERAAQAPAANEDALDAARYRFVRDVPYTDEIRNVMALQQNAIMDETIDAAMQRTTGSEE